MFGIYKYENGLKFTGEIATSKEAAESYLGAKYGQIEKCYTGKHDKDGYPIYEDKFVPYYNKDAFVIKSLKTIG